MSTVGGFKLASVLLQYPTDAVFSGIRTLRAAAATTPKAAREPFDRFLGWLDATSPMEVTQHYVQTFDLRRRCALYLTYYRFGDTRKRGTAMLAYKAAYRQAAFEPATDELPDYLPLVLEFADLSTAGVQLLRRKRPEVELVRRALHRAETPYAALLDAVAAQLPRLRRQELSLVNRHWEEGPPSEDVGLEPFAPPEYVSGYGSAHE